MKKNILPYLISVLFSQILMGGPRLKMIDLVKEFNQTAGFLDAQDTSSINAQLAELKSVVTPNSDASVIQILKSISSNLGSANASVEENVQQLANLLSGYSGQTLVDKLNTLIDQMNRDKSDLSWQIQLREADIQNLNSSLAQTQNRLGDVNQQLNEANSAKASLLGQINQIESTIESLKNTNAVLQTTIDAHIKTNADLTSTIHTLQNTITAANASIDSLTNQKSALQTSLTAANASVADLTTQKATLESDKATLQTSLTAANTTIQNSAASIKSGETVIATAVTAVNTTLGGTGTTYARATNAVTSIKSDAADLTTAVSAVNTVLGGNGSNSLYIFIQNLNHALDDSVTSLPNGVSFLTVNSITLGSGMITINSNVGTYSCLWTTSMSPDDSIAFTNGSNTLTLINKSGGSINNASVLFNYLKSMYSVGSKISQNMLDLVTLLVNQVGGSVISLRARIAEVNRMILKTPTGVLATDMTTLRGKIVSSPGTSVEDDVATVAGLLDGVVSTTDNALLTLSAIIYDNNNSILLITGSDTYAYFYNGPIASNALFNFVHTTDPSIVIVFKNYAGEINSFSGLSNYMQLNYPIGSKLGDLIEGRINTVNAALGGIGTTYARVTDLSSKVDGVVSTPDNATLTLSSITDDNSSKITLTIGSNTYQYSYSNNIASNALFNFVHTTDPSKVIVFKNCAGEINSFSGLSNYMQQNYPVGSKLSGVFDDKITTVNTTLGGTGTTYARATGVRDSIKSDAPDLTTAVTAVNTALGGNGSSSVCAFIQICNQALDDSVNSLPSGVSSSIVNSITLGSGMITINSNVGTYSCSANSVGSGSSINFSNTSNTLTFTLCNRSGGILPNQSALLNYLKSMYPVNSRISLNMTDMIDSLKIQVGGFANSLRARIAAVDRMIIDAPTGVLATDITSLRSRIVSPLGTSAEHDVATVARLLDGSTSVLQTIIGSPQLNGSSENVSLASIIGGSGSLAAQLGDPGTGTGGISALIKSGNVSDQSYIFNQQENEVQAFNNAQSISDQLQAFIAIINSGSFSIQQGGSYSSLSDILNALSSPIAA
ncbi:MAG: Chromosome partition protein Smc [Holosporales bacterium]